MRDGVVTVRLETALNLANRLALLDALEAQPGPVSLVRLDAASLRDLDTAGLGMLARVVRFAQDAASRRPVLLNASESVRAEMGAARLLPHFDLEPPAA
jgi:anti-anti-sigma regulatory factor